MATVLRNLPTRLRDEDLLGFAPLEVVTIRDLRRRRVKGVKALAGAITTAAVGYVLYKGAVEAKAQYDELEAIAAGDG